MRTLFRRVCAPRHVRESDSTSAKRPTRSARRAFENVRGNRSEGVLEDARIHWHTGLVGRATFEGGGTRIPPPPIRPLSEIASSANPFRFFFAARSRALAERAPSAVSPVERVLEHGIEHVLTPPPFLPSAGSRTGPRFLIAMLSCRPYGGIGKSLAILAPTLILQWAHI